MSGGYSHDDDVVDVVTGRVVEGPTTRDEGEAGGALPAEQVGGQRGLGHLGSPGHGEHTSGPVGELNADPVAGSQVPQSPEHTSPSSAVDVADEGR